MPYKKITKAALLILGAGLIVIAAGTILMGGTWEPFMEGSEAWYRVIHITP